MTNDGSPYGAKTKEEHHSFFDNYAARLYLLSVLAAGRALLCLGMGIRFVCFFKTEASGQCHSLLFQFLLICFATIIQENEWRSFVTSVI